MGFITLAIAVVTYTKINRSRDRIQRELEEQGITLSPKEIRELGDRAPDFRYTL